MTGQVLLERVTRETKISGALDLRGDGVANVETGLGFLDHMLETLAKHSGISLALKVMGDLAIDDHHTVEDCAVVIGRALDEAVDDRAGINRFGYAYAPLDEAMCRAVIDLSGRGWAEIDLRFSRDTIGEVASENIVHFFTTLAAEARMALHLDLIRGANSHHVAESAFKAVAIALRDAVTFRGSGVPSTKGVLG